MASNAVLYFSNLLLHFWENPQLIVRTFEACLKVPKKSWQEVDSWNGSYRSLKRIWLFTSRLPHGKTWGKQLWIIVYKLCLTTNHLGNRISEIALFSMLAWNQISCTTRFSPSSSAEFNTQTSSFMEASRVCNSADDYTLYRPFSNYTKWFQP